MDFGTAIKTCFSKYGVFDGQASKSEFWYWFLFYIICGIASAIVDVFISDLANTYCNYLKDKNSCDQKFFGNNLSLDEKAFKKNKHEIYLPNNKNTFSKFEDFTKYEIFNDVSLLDSLKLNNIILSQ